MIFCIFKNKILFYYLMFAYCVDSNNKLNIKTKRSTLKILLLEKSKNLGYLSTKIRIL